MRTAPTSPGRPKPNWRRAESTTYSCEHELTSAGIYANQAEVETESGVSEKSNIVEVEASAKQIVQAACTVNEPAIVLRGVAGSKKKPFTAQISALGIKELTFYLDGRSSRR